MSQNSGHVDVQIHHPVEWEAADEARLKNDWGWTLWPLPEVTGSWLTVNSYPFRPSFLWLEERGDMSKSIFRYSCLALREWVDFRCNVQNAYVPTNEDFWEVMILEASKSDYKAFRTHLRHEADVPISTSEWNKRNSALVDFYKHMEEAWNIAAPWTVEVVGGWRGRTSLSNWMGQSKNASPVGIALTPEQCDVLLQAARKVDADFDETSMSPTLSRDEAFIRHALGTGRRRDSLRLCTVYEVPKPSGLWVGIGDVADATAKNQRGGVALTLEHHLDRVRTYIRSENGRPLLVERSKEFHQPARPLQLIEADSNGWVAIAGNGMQVDNTWHETTDEDRLRMVDIGGGSPLVHLTRDGTPLGERSASGVVANACKWAQENVDEEVPHTRLHDLRDTFAVHLVVGVYLGLLRDLIEDTGEAYDKPTLSSAVTAVATSLGHAHETTTVDHYLTWGTFHLLRVVDKPELLAKYTGVN